MEHLFSPKAGIFFRLGKWLGLAAVLNVGWAVSLQAESNLKISGQVFDSLTGRPISGAAVEMVETGSRTTTNLQGEFWFYDLPAGNYRLKIESSSYQTRLVSVKLFSDGVTELEARLSPISITGPPLVVTAESLGASPLQPSLVFDRIELEKSKHLSAAQLLSHASGMDLKARGVYGSTEERSEERRVGKECRL